MNTPSPLSPLSPLSQASKGKSNVRIAVVTIIALHAVFFGGLLLQGCKKTPETSLASLPTNSVPTNELPPLNGSPYAAAPAVTNAPAAPLWPTNAPSNWAAPGSNVEAAIPAAPANEIVPAVAHEGTDYKIKKGDTPAKIAKAHGVSLDALLQANPGLEPRKLKVNQTIHLPAGSKGATTRAAATEAATTAAPAEAGVSATVHEVKPGENLTRIAHKYGVTVKAIRQANGLKSDRINAGQKLKIPGAKVAAPVAAEPSAPAPAANPIPAPVENTNLPPIR
jgi:LysM repeat protein